MRTFCPVYLAEMRPLMTSLFCPNDCDRKEAAVPDGSLMAFVAVPSGQRWKMVRRDGSFHPTPRWATRAWIIGRNHQFDSNLSLDELAMNWEKMLKPYPGSSPGWDIRCQKIDMTGAFLFFGPVGPA